MIHPDTCVKTVSPALGNGVFATRDIPMGTLVVVRDRYDTCLSPAEFIRLPALVRESMETYMYHDKRGNLILSWDHARYMNPCCHSNTMMTDYRLEIAVRDIRTGEEVTSEYGLLNIQEPYEIHCGCENCRKYLRTDDIDVYGARWDTQILQALRKAPDIPQPLWGLLPANTQERLCELCGDSGLYSSVRGFKWRSV